MGSKRLFFSSFYNLEQIHNELFIGIAKAINFSYQHPKEAIQYITKSSFEFANIAIEKIPDAMHQAIVLDGAVATVIGSALMITPLAPAAGMGGFVTYISSSIIGATIAYDLRAAAHEYFKDSEHKFAICCVIGGMAGGLKYGIKHVYKSILNAPTNYFQEIKYGMLNIFLYENLKSLNDLYTQQHNYNKILGSLNLVEGFETTWRLLNSEFLNSAGNPVVKNPGLIAGILTLSGTILLTHQLANFFMGEQKDQQAFTMITSKHLGTAIFPDSSELLNPHQDNINHLDDLNTANLDFA